MAEFIEMVAHDTFAASDLNKIVYFNSDSKVILAQNATPGDRIAGVLLSIGNSGARVRVGVKGIFLVVAGATLKPQYPCTATAGGAGSLGKLVSAASTGDLVVGSLKYIESNGTVHTSTNDQLSNFHIDTTNVSIRP